MARRTDPVPGTKIYVGNLAWSIDENGLEHHFTPFGQVVDKIIIKDRETGRSKGFGFVTFADTQSATTAMNQMNGQQVEGRAIRVNLANDKAGSGAGGYGGGGGVAAGGFGSAGGGYGGAGGYGGGYAAGSYAAPMGGYGPPGGYGGGAPAYGGAQPAYGSTGYGNGSGGYGGGYPQQSGYPQGGYQQGGYQQHPQGGSGY